MDRIIQIANLDSQRLLQPLPEIEFSAAYNETSLFKEN